MNARGRGKQKTSTNTGHDCGDRMPWFCSSLRLALAMAMGLPSKFLALTLPTLPPLPCTPRLADLMNYTSRMTYEQFIQCAQHLSELDTFPVLCSRAQAIGFRVTKVR